jgi:hypothetical protein
MSAPPTSAFNPRPEHLAAGQLGGPAVAFFIIPRYFADDRGGDHHHRVRHHRADRRPGRVRRGRRGAGRVLGRLCGDRPPDGQGRHVLLLHRPHGIGRPFGVGEEVW